MKKSLKRLIIDTATRYIYLSLIVDDKELDWIYQIGDNDHSVTIMPMLENLMAKQSIELNEIDQIIVGIGPGSYTGVRIGVTVAKMIAYLNQAEILQVSSLALMASSSDEKYILSLIDARRGNAFMALFKQEEKQIEYIKEDVLQNIDIFKKTINLDFQIVESGKPNIEKLLNSDLFSRIDNVHDLVPNYLQVTEAEKNLHK